MNRPSVCYRRTVCCARPRWTGWCGTRPPDERRGGAGMGVQTLGDQTFDEVVRGSTLPVLVDFTAAWCPPCRAVEPIVEQLAEDLAGQLVVARVDVDASPDTAARHRVMSMPTFLVLV